MFVFRVSSSTRPVSFAFVPPTNAKSVGSARAHTRTYPVIKLTLVRPAYVDQKQEIFDSVTRLQ